MFSVAIGPGRPHWPVPAAHWAHDGPGARDPVLPGRQSWELPGHGEIQVLRPVPVQPDEPSGDACARGHVCNHAVRVRRHLWEADPFGRRPASQPRAFEHHRPSHQFTR